MSRLITRRHLAGGLGVLAAAPLLSHAARADLAAVETAARKEGTVTWYIAQLDTETAEAAGRAFNKRYPDIKVQVIRTTGQVAYQRLSEDLKNGARQCDVFSTTDIAQMPMLKARNALAQYVPENAAGIAPGLQGLSDPGYYYPTNATVALIIYNTKKVKPEDAPKSWTDLLDSKWKNQSAFGHPAFSGCTGVWVVNLRKHYGWEYFEKLAKNNPQIGRSGNDAITLLNSGERSVALGPLASTLLGAQAGNPLAIQYPTDGVTVCNSPSAVVKDAPHPNAARLLMDWLLSQEFAQFCADNWVDPVRTDVKTKPGIKSLSDVKVMQVTMDEIGKGIPEVIEQWRDTFGN